MQRVALFFFILTAAVLFLEGWTDRAIGAAEFSSPGQTASDDSVAVIINSSNPVENLSLAELRKIFLGEHSHWPNGRRIALVMMAPGQPERKAVLREIYRMNENDFTNHFIRGLFTGEVFVSPKVLATPVEVRKFVFNVPGAIGYVRLADVDTSVKTVHIDGRLPDDKEYGLRLQPHAGK